MMFLCSSNDEGGRREKGGGRREEGGGRRGVGDGNGGNGRLQLMASGL